MTETVRQLFYSIAKKDLFFFLGLWRLLWKPACGTLLWRFHLPPIFRLPVQSSESTTRKNRIMIIVWEVSATVTLVYLLLI